MLKHMTLMKLVELIEQENDDDINKLKVQMEDLRKVFKRLDKNNSSKISKIELKQYYEDLGIKISSEKAELIL